MYNTKWERMIEFITYCFPTSFKVQELVDASMRVVRLTTIFKTKQLSSVLQQKSFDETFKIIDIYGFSVCTDMNCCIWGTRDKIYRNIPIFRATVNSFKFAKLLVFPDWKHFLQVVALSRLVEVKKVMCLIRWPPTKSCRTSNYQSVCLNNAIICICHTFAIWCFGNSTIHVSSTQLVNLTFQQKSNDETFHLVRDLSW